MINRRAASPYALFTLPRTATAAPPDDARAMLTMSLSD